MTSSQPPPTYTNGAPTTTNDSSKPSRLRTTTLLALDPTNRFATSWLLLPPFLLALRLLICVYIFTTIFFTYGWDGTHNDGIAVSRSFSYFTNLCYWGEGFYFLFAAIHTAVYWRTGRNAFWGERTGGRRGGCGTALRALHWILYASITVFPIVVTIVFWSLLSKGALSTAYSTYSNISMHALNTVFAVLEILVPRTLSLPWLALPALVVLIALYLGLAYVTHATQGFYVYPFLNIKSNGSGIVAGYCIGILVGLCIIFCLVKGLMSLRILITERRMGMTGKMGQWGVGMERGQRGAGYEDIEVAQMKAGERGPGAAATKATEVP